MRDNISDYNRDKGAGPGRPAGSANKITLRIREAFSLLLENNLDSLEELIHRIAEDDPKGAVELYIKLSERFLPRLTQTQLTGAEGGELRLSFTFGQKPSEETSEDSEV